MICENCGKEHDGTFGSGRFCCKSCSISFGNKIRNKTKEERDLINKKISEGLVKYFIDNKKEKKLHEYICEKCGSNFKSPKIKKGRHIYCDKCKRNVVHYKNINDVISIKDLSRRTITKILYRSNIGCAICNWKESTCDIHHIVPKSKGGSDNCNNLIIVCPNCHRVIHTTNKYSQDFLFENSIEKKFSNWKDFYHPSN